jgi:hypothetical protein
MGRNLHLHHSVRGDALKFEGAPAVVLIVFGYLARRNPRRLEN